MATLTELFNSRVSGSHGIFGSQGLTTTWHVEVDSVDDDPRAALSEPGAGGVVLGQPFPWEASGAVAQMADIVERHSPTLYTVVVRYGVAGALQPDIAWTITTSGATQIAKRLKARTDPDNPQETEPIGPRKYVKKTWYDVQDPPPDGVDTSQVYKATVDVDGNEKSILLYRFADPSARRAEGIDIPQPVASMRYSTRITQLNKNAIVQGLSYVNSINDDFFGGFKPETVRCSAVTVSESPGVIEGQAITGVVFDIGIDFEINFNGHQPVELADTYIGDNGTQSFITKVDSREAETTEYRFASRVNFNDLLGLYLVPRVGRGRPTRA